MAEPLLTILEQLDARVQALQSENERLRNRAATLETENADLRRAADESARTRDRALLDAEFLAVSHRLADSPESLVSARRHIARLIRNIDRCLEMLKE